MTLVQVLQNGSTKCTRSLIMYTSKCPNKTAYIGSLPESLQRILRSSLAKLSVNGPLEAASLQRAPPCRVRLKVRLTGRWPQSSSTLIKYTRHPNVPIMLQS